MRLPRLPALSGLYASEEAFPLTGYLVTGTAYAALVAGLAVAVRRSGHRLPERPAMPDVVLLAAATHKLSRMLAKDSITRPLRAPFTRFERAAGGAELVERVRGRGVWHAAGELVSCPFCLAVWVSTGLTAGLVLAPRLTRLVCGGLTAVAASDFLQLGYAAAKDGHAAAKDGHAAEGGRAAELDGEGYPR